MASNVEFTCFVRGLDQNTDGNDLKNIFSKFGNVIDSKVRYKRLEMNLFFVGVLSSHH